MKPTEKLNAALFLKEATAYTPGRGRNPGAASQGSNPPPPTIPQQQMGLGMIGGLAGHAARLVRDRFSRQ